VSEGLAAGRVGITPAGFAEPDSRVQPAAAVTPDDPFHRLQWDLWDAATGMNVPPAWELATGKDVPVAVIDTGYAAPVARRRTKVRAVPVFRDFRASRTAWSERAFGEPDAQPTINSSARGGCWGRPWRTAAPRRGETAPRAP
jgi:hypothetical protein